MIGSGLEALGFAIQLRAVGWMLAFQRLGAGGCEITGLLVYLSITGSCMYVGSPWGWNFLLVRGFRVL